LKAVAHDKICATAQRLDKRLQSAEIITVVGIAHDAMAPARAEDGAIQGRAITADGNVDHARTEPPGNLLRAVGRAIVADVRLRAR
jgi:hypothetical protein